MNLTVVGTGFVGVVTAAVFAKLGHQVIGLDIDEAKVEKLKLAEVPFYEPNLEELLKHGQDEGRLTFTTDYAQAVRDADIIMIAVGTPSAPDGTADLKYVFSAAESLAPHIKERAIVVVKSTVPPGTNAKVQEIIQRHSTKEFSVASVPEFLREGRAVEDTLNPDRIVIGASQEWAKEKLLNLHENLPGKRILIAPESAQMAKYTANAYLAQRITFINQIANLCEKNGAHINEVIEAIGEDKRIGSHYWYPGLGYGGSCFPKDVKELAAYAREVGESNGLLVKIDELNEQRLPKKLNEMKQKVGGFDGKTVAVLGLSFKPHTNDMREAPSLKVVPYLVEQGATIKAYDPEAMSEAKKQLPEITYADTPYQAIENANIILLLIEWPELTSLDLAKIADITSGDVWFIDTRNQYQRSQVEAQGLHYLGVGNP